jgi:uncharacterized surface protein with fasciclin (FAS1) repeats
MKTNLFLTTVIGLFIVTAGMNCSKEESKTNITGGMGSVEDSVSQKTVVGIAIGSKDHTTLVAAVKAAGLVDSLANPGPFTVFAPTNDAFNKLPKGTVENLLESSKLEDLKNILEYNVIVGTYKLENLQDGQTIGMVNGGNIAVTVKDGKPIINGNSKILASVPASNGIVHVVDNVLLPAN